MKSRSSTRLRALRYPLVLALALLATACGKGGDTTTPAATDTAASGTPAAAAPAAAPSDVPAFTRQPGPIVPPQGPAPVLGEDYEEIPGGTPWQANPGKVEVVEVFGYVCPACAAFAPIVEPWHAKLPADVDFHYVPAPFGPEWDPYAKAYFVAEQQGLVERSHMALIDAIHVKDSMPGEGDKPDEQKIGQFYAQYGANPQQFVEMMNSFAVATKVNQGRQWMQKAGVSGTPTVIVAGKYRITTRKGFGDVLRVAEHLIARERAGMAQGGAQPTAPAAAPTPAPAG